MIHDFAIDPFVSIVSHVFPNGSRWTSYVERTFEVSWKEYKRQSPCLCPVGAFSWRNPHSSGRFELPIPVDLSFEQSFTRDSGEDDMGLGYR